MRVLCEQRAYSKTSMLVFLTNDSQLILKSSSAFVLLPSWPPWSFATRKLNLSDGDDTHEKRRREGKGKGKEEQKEDVP